MINRLRSALVSSLSLFLSDLVSQPLLSSSSYASLVPSYTSDDSRHTGYPYGAPGAPEVSSDLRKLMRPTKANVHFERSIASMQLAVIRECGEVLLYRTVKLLA